MYIYLLYRYVDIHLNACVCKHFISILVSVHAQRVVASGRNAPDSCFSVLAPQFAES